MIVKTQSKTSLKRFPMLLVAGAFAVAPLLDPVSVQAQSSKSKAKPAKGAEVTLIGAVTRDVPGNEFYFRADDGRTFRVVTRTGEPGWIAAGARLQMSGRHDGDLFVAATLKPLNNSGKPGGNAGNNDRITLTGAVTQDLAGNQFYFRADDGRTFRVTTRNAQPAWITAGKRAQVRGWRDGDLFIAESVQPLTNTNTGGYQQGERMVIKGYVTRDLNGNEFYLRTHEGQQFRVRLVNRTEPRWVTVGNRVQVHGYREGDIFHADVLNLLPKIDDYSKSNATTLTGVVTQDLSGNDFYFRTDDNRTFRVRTRTAEPSWIAAGNRVEVRGRRDARQLDIIHADTLRLLSQQGAGAVGQRLDFNGVVVKVHSRTSLDVRGDNGRTYRVASASNLSTRVTAGDRVRIVGRSTGTSTVGSAAVTLVADNNPGNTTATAVNFSGRVESVSNNGLIRNLRVRGDNGQVYSVTYRDLQTFRVGDRVRVIGTANKGVVTATSITML